MTKDLSLRLREFETELNHSLSKNQSYCDEMKNIIDKSELNFVAGKISGYIDVKELFYRSFPELKPESP